MKNWLVFFLLTFGANTFALESRNHAINVNVATIAVGNYEVAYDHKLDDHFSFAASVIYYEGRKVLWRVYSLGYFIGAGFMPKFHLFGRAHESSFYIAPSLRLGYVDHPAPDASQKADRSILSRLGANFGYQHVFSFGLMLDFVAGLEHYYGFSLTQDTTRFQSSSEGKLRFDLRPYFAVMAGYAF